MNTGMTSIHALASHATRTATANEINSTAIDMLS